MAEYPRIINSILDTDLYTLTVGQAAAMESDQVDVMYKFVNRGNTQFPPGFAQELQNQILELSLLRLQPEERSFLEERCYYLRRMYIDWLSQFRFKPEQVQIHQHGGNLDITIQGPWYQTIYWEVPLLALISELYYTMSGADPNSTYRETGRDKGYYLSEIGADFIDFGTRRRFSFDVHDQIIGQLRDSGGIHFKGTSNVFLAFLYKLTPHGTMSHQWVQAQAGIHGVREATQQALIKWEREFRGNLGIALSDTYTTEEFLTRFDSRLARLFDGVRQDSGDELEFVDKMVAHYKKHHINPSTKRIVFSNGLNVERVREIHEYSGNLVRPSYGIGTNFTNDVGHTPLNIVIKLFAVRTGENDRWVDVVKLSDDLEKATGDPTAIQAAKYELGLTV